MRQRRQRRLLAHQRRLVGGRDDDDRACQAFGTEIVLEELLDLAAAFADQPDHVDVGAGIARQHREQHRFADAGAGENAHALADAAGQEGVQRPDAEIERGANASACMGWRRVIAKCIETVALRQGRPAIDRAAERIDDAAEPGHCRV